MQSGGKPRSYILHLPAGGGTKLPLMIILHGFGMTGADQQNSVKMDGIADREKFIVAYPNAIDKQWDQAGDSDWKFILAVLDSCAAAPTVIRPYPATNPKSLVTRITWKGCEGGTEVIADSVNGGPHEWPMDIQTKVNTSEEAWAFFKRFSLSGSTALRRDASPDFGRTDRQACTMSSRKRTAKLPPSPWPFPDSTDRNLRIQEPS